MFSWKRRFCENTFPIKYFPKTENIDSKLIVGSSLFGVGWGLVGFCPGPAIASLALVNEYAIFFLISMFGGFFLTRLVNYK